jgi:hypothetical protein
MDADTGTRVVAGGVAHDVKTAAHSTPRIWV